MTNQQGPTEPDFGAAIRRRYWTASATVDVERTSVRPPKHGWLALLRRRIGIPKAIGHHPGEHEPGEVARLLQSTTRHFVATTTSRSIHLAEQRRIDQIEHRRPPAHVSHHERRRSRLIRTKHVRGLQPATVGRTVDRADGRLRSWTKSPASYVEGHNPLPGLHHRESARVAGRNSRRNPPHRDNGTTGQYQFPIGNDRLAAMHLHGADKRGAIASLRPLVAARSGRVEEQTSRGPATRPPASPVGRAGALRFTTPRPVDLPTALPKDSTTDQTKPGTTHLAVRQQRGVVLVDPVRGGSSTDTAAAKPQHTDTPSLRDMPSPSDPSPATPQTQSWTRSVQREEPLNATRSTDVDRMIDGVEQRILAELDRRGVTWWKRPS